VYRSGTQLNSQAFCILSLLTIVNFTNYNRIWVHATYTMQLANKFKKPPGYVIASVLCSFGGFLFGHDTGIIGPVTVMEDFTKYVGNPSPTIHGLIVSSILIPAAMASFFAGKLADRLGRTRGIAIGSFIFALGAAIEAASVHIAMFIVGRVVAGVGEGLYLGTLVV
jgi:MFS family permease